MRTYLALSVLFAAACGNDEPNGLVTPSRESRLATAEAIDAARGFGEFTIGQPKGRLVNVGHPDSFEYFEGGVKLAVYRKARVKVKLGDVTFGKVALYFGRTNEMQMFRLHADVDRAKCETARANFDELYGAGLPKSPDKYMWIGHVYQATWEYITKGAKPTCFVEVRAVNPK